MSAREEPHGAERNTAEEASAPEKKPTPTPEPKPMAGSPGEPRGQRPEEFNPDDFE